MLLWKPKHSQKELKKFNWARVLGFLFCSHLFPQFKTTLALFNPEEET